jgi:opacity protein-like surface antigen
MKKILFGILAFAVIFTASASATDFMYEFKAHYFNPTEQRSEDIYGSGWAFGGEFAFGVAESLFVYFSGSYYARTGELTYTREETKLKIIPLALGAKYHFNLTRGLNFYGGAGLTYHIYMEENPIGEANKNGFGFVINAGLLTYVTEGLFLDGYVNYSYCKMKPANVDINIGGLEAGLGIGYKF